jgi:hypothetical protein
MRKYFLSALFILNLFVCFGQNAKTSSVMINKVTQPCVVMDYYFDVEIIEGALYQKMTNAKLGKGEKTKDGFRLYKGITITEIAPEKMDYYFNVEDRKQSATVYMLCSKGYDNFLRSDDDSIVIQNIFKYLTSFATDANVFALNQDIEKQNDLIKDGEKKSKNAVEDAERLQKDRAKIESKIANNILDTENLKKEIEMEQKNYDNVKIKTATVDGMKALKKEVKKAESNAKKAEKRYSDGLKDAIDYKEDLAKTDRKIEENKNLQATLKTQLETDKAQLSKLTEALNGLRK